MPPAETQLRRDPAALMLALSRSGADIVAYRAGRERGYLLNAPDHIAHVLVGYAENYSRNTFSHRMFQAAVAEGLLTFEGERWQRERRIVEPAFDSRHVAAMDADVGAAVARLIDRWDDLAVGGADRDIAHEMSLLALDITVGGLFGHDIGADVEGVGTAIARAVGLLTAADHPHFVDARQTVHALVAQIVEARAAQRDPRDDLLSLLLETRRDGGPAVDDAALRDRVVTFLLAGSQTTANTLTWTLHLLAENPGERARVEREVAAFADGAVARAADVRRLPCTRMAIQESMRLYPTAWIVGRRAIADDEIGGVTIAAGTTVALSPYTMHRHPRYWDHPDEFRPQRFARSATAGRPRFAYFPFGGGPRSCIGARLAMVETVVVVAALTRRFRLRHAPGREVVAEGGILLRPRDGMWAAIERI